MEEFIRGPLVVSLKISARVAKLPEHALLQIEQGTPYSTPYTKTM
jgi:hypothetical protein